MSVALHPTDLSLLAARLASAGVSGLWTALLLQADDDVERIADELAEAVREVAGVEALRVRVNVDAPDLVHEVQRTESLLVISGLDALTPADWQRLDLLRSALRREAGVALVASRGAFEQLERHAPNLLSWFTTVYELDEAAGVLTDDERRERIAALERWSGLSSAEAIARAESGKLPADPEYREWLVLLDRGDLLAR